jgi:hypothetical protein
MKAKNIPTPSVEELEELFDRPDQTPAVKQELLREYVEIEDQIRLARLDLDAVGAEITELLLTDAPVQGGAFTGRLLSGRLVVCWKDPEEEDSRNSLSSNLWF